MNSSSPIGIFDSGVGGLSVLREIRSAFANEDLLYVADSASVPYGDKSPQFVEARSVAITEFLVDRKAKAIVVACNTATGAAIATLRSRFSVPIVGIEPAVKPAVGKTASGVVAVLATSGTLAGEKFAQLLTRFGGDADILIRPCPGLVEQVETGDLDGEKARALIANYLLPLLARGADTIILGSHPLPFPCAADPGDRRTQSLNRRSERSDRPRAGRGWKLNGLLSPDPRSGTSISGQAARRMT